MNPNRSLLPGLALCSLAWLAPSRALSAQEIQVHEVHHGVVPVGGVMTADDLTKPFLPAAPQPKVEPKHGDAPHPQGPLTAPVNSPETPAPVDAVGPTVLAPVIRRNASVTFTSQSRSTVSEPTVAQWNNTLLYTHNWDAAVSTNGGTSWTRRDPRSFSSIDGGFCCDQWTVYAPESGKEICAWLLQYVYSTSTQKNTQRVVIYNTEDRMRSGTSYWYDFNPGMFGFTATHWLDFPHMITTANYLYMTTNVFKYVNSSTSTYAGSVCWRVSLAQLKAGGTVNYSYYKRTSGGATWRLAEGSRTTTYWWQLENTSTGRLYSWPDSGSLTSKTIGVSSFTYISGGVCLDKSGRNYLGRASTRPLAGWVGKGVIGFGWTCGPRTSRPMAYTRFVRISQSTLNKLSDNDVWNSSGCWTYPATAINSRGDVGGVISYGQSDRYPGVACWISDPTDTGLVANSVYFASGQGGPSRNAWGDYMSVARHPKYPNSWIATGMAMNSVTGADTNQIPRYVWFGRSADVAVRPDLTPTTLTSSTTSLNPLYSISVSSTVLNDGEGSSASSGTVGFYLSTNSTISTGDTLLGSVSLVAQSAHASRTYSRTVTVPANATPGTCYLGVYVDNTFVQTEEKETNNTRALAVTCRTPIADLQVSAFQASPTTFRRGATVAVQAIVRNAGNLASPTCTSGFYLSTDSVITTSDALLRSWTTPAIAALSSAPTYSSSVVIPVTSPIGTCYLGAYADRTNVVTESSNSNNYRSQQVVCQDGTPDLTISGIAAATTGTGGGTISVKITTANIGTGIAPTSTTGVLLSTNTAISTADDLLGVYSVASLNPSTSSTRTASYTLPRCYTSSTAYLGGWADVSGTITELSESNNTRASSAVVFTPYSGSGRYVEWDGAIGTAALSPYGAANFTLVAGPRTAGMCVVAPRNIGDWHLLLWSGNPYPNLTIDALTNLGLGLVNGPICPGYLSRIPTSGRTFPATKLPAVKGIGLLRLYVHSAWFDGAFTTFKGFGSNSAAASVGS
ncbi:MAG: hypothetical protein KDC95_02060 [Planctomycetes bacterium]|nr:hypothetical protein [Planctomycetota bacterium]